MGSSCMHLLTSGFTPRKSALSRQRVNSLCCCSWRLLQKGEIVHGYNPPCLFQEVEWSEIGTIAGYRYSCTNTLLAHVQLRGARLRSTYVTLQNALLLEPEWPVNITILSLKHCYYTILSHLKLLLT